MPMTDPIKEFRFNTKDSIDAKSIGQKQRYVGQKSIDQKTNRQMPNLYEQPSSSNVRKLGPS